MKVLGSLIILATLVWASFEVMNLVSIGDMAQANPAKLIVIFAIGATLATLCFTPEKWALPVVLPIVGAILLGFEIYSSIAVFSLEKQIFGDVSNILVGVFHICSGIALAAFMFALSAKMVKDIKATRG